ncbi:MAG TPA: LysR family transcriptional regulator [Propionibacteriaceae bacterium]|jgi:DNA-binding transcriptional LysR family regulator|nr:LysR family transcriptional regulator [Propionibacteriaceae bacterium]
MRPDLRSLELLVALAEAGSLSGAGRVMGMAQPNVSRALSRLERQLSVQLVTRTPSGSSLTPEGVVVLEWARAALDAVDRVTIGAKSLAAQEETSLRVAASLTVAEYLAPSWLARLRRARPDVRVSLAVSNSDLVLEQVISGEVDLGFVEAPTVPRTVSSRVVARDELVVVVGPAHPWVSRLDPVGPTELATTDLVMRESGSGTRQTLERALRVAGVRLGDSHLELASTAAVKSAAAAGDNPAVLSELAVASELGTGSLIRVPVEGLRLGRRLRAVWPAGVPLGGIAADLVQLASETPLRHP